MRESQNKKKAVPSLRKLAYKAPGILGFSLRGNELLQKNFWIILFLDIILISICYCAAHWLRFDGILDSAIRNHIIVTIAPLALIKISSFFIFNLYKGMWRYAGISDLLNVIKASITSSILFVVYLAVYYHFSGVSRGVLVIDFILTIVLIGGMRLLIRLYYQREQVFFHEISFFRKAQREKKNVLIIGTGHLAENLFREVRNLDKFSYKVIGFIDVNIKYRGLKIHGVPILGSLEDVHDLVDCYEIEYVWIADITLEPSKIAEVIESCEGLSVHFKVIPSISERLLNNVAENLRDIRIEDLLERNQVTLEMQLIRSEIENQTVMITGAGGSIGSELAIQICAFNPKQLILLDNAETPLYLIDMELQTKAGNTEVIPCIGDVRSRRCLDRIFDRYKPRFVYHAAAYKHVPMMELSPLDAVNNNVIGTFKLANAACKHHVEKFIMISTDKAVRPTSVMGATKRVAEMVVQSMNGNGTRFVVVRFGNVLASNGSVVPLFQKQIAAGGPVTVTHPGVRRYFMTISEAVMLILQAGSIGRGGELFLLDMGKPIKIHDLARNMIRLAGLTPDTEIKIEFIGLRPGEKIYEELLIAGEGVLDTAFEKIKICNNADGIDEAVLYEAIGQFSLLLKGSGDNDAAITILKKLVPEFNKNHYVPRPGVIQRNSNKEDKNR